MLPCALVLNLMELGALSPCLFVAVICISYSVFGLRSLKLQVVKGAMNPGLNWPVPKSLILTTYTNAGSISNSNMKPLSLSKSSGSGPTTGALTLKALPSHSTEGSGGGGVTLAMIFLLCCGQIGGMDEPDPLMMQPKHMSPWLRNKRLYETLKGMGLFVTAVPFEDAPDKINWIQVLA